MNWWWRLLLRSRRWRGTAIERLRGARDAHAVPLLVRLLSDSGQDVADRCAAASALGDIGDAGAVAALHDCVHAPRIGEAALLALDRLGWSPSTTREQILLALAKRDYSAVAEQGNEGVEFLVSALQDERAQPWRNDIVAALATIASPLARRRAAEALVAALRDEDVREAAVRALRSLGASAVPALADALADTGRPDSARAAVAHAMGDIGDVQFVEALSNVIRNTKQHGELVSCAATASLGRIGGPAAAAALVEALADRRLERTAVRALGCCGDRSVAERLVSRLKSRDSTVRQEALEALSTLGWEPQDDRERGLRSLAQGDFQTALKHVPHDEATGALTTALQSDDLDTVKWAARKLAWTREAPAVRVLVSALRKGEQMVGYSSRAAAEISPSLVSSGERLDVQRLDRLMAIDRQLKWVLQQVSPELSAEDLRSVVHLKRQWESKRLAAAELERRESQGRPKQ